MNDTYMRYLTLFEHVITVLFFLVPVVGNAVSRILKASGAPDAARKLDARIPYALNAMTEADKIAKGAIVLVKAETPIVVVDKSKDPPPPPPAGLGGVVLAFGMVLCLTGCQASLVPLAEISNYASQTESEAAPIIVEECTVPAQALASVADATERKTKALALDKVCAPIIDGYDETRTSLIQLNVLLTKAAAGQPIDLNDMLGTADGVATSVTKMNDAIRAMNAAKKAAKQ